MPCGHLLYQRVRLSFNELNALNDTRRKETRMTLEAVYGTYATTDNEAQAAAIAQRLIGEEGRDATVWDVEDLVERGYPIRTSFRYAVLAARLEQM